MMADVDDCITIVDETMMTSEIIVTCSKKRIILKTATHHKLHYSNKHTHECIPFYFGRFLSQFVTNRSQFFSDHIKKAPKLDRFSNKLSEHVGCLRIVRIRFFLSRGSNNIIFYYGGSFFFLKYCYNWILFLSCMGIFIPFLFLSYWSNFNPLFHYCFA